MVDTTLVPIIEEIHRRIAKMDAENLALQQVVTAIISSMPDEQASLAKKKLYEVIDYVEKGGSAATLELLEVQKPLYQRLFLHAK